MRGFSEVFSIVASQRLVTDIYSSLDALSAAHHTVKYTYYCTFVTRVAESIKLKATFFPLELFGVLTEQFTLTLDRMLYIYFIESLN